MGPVEAALETAGAFIKNAAAANSSMGPRAERRMYLISPIGEVVTLVGQRRKWKRYDCQP
jgi:hypothetical protein